MDGMNNVWGMGYGWLIGLFVLVVIIWLVVKLVNQIKKYKPGALRLSSLHSVQCVNHVIYSKFPEHLSWPFRIIYY
jgi:hypothetical protein